MAEINIENRPPFSKATLAVWPYEKSSALGKLYIPIQMRGITDKMKAIDVIIRIRFGDIILVNLAKMLSIVLVIVLLVGPFVFNDKYRLSFYRFKASPDIAS